MYEYQGKVYRVVDGDTLIIDVDLGFETFTRTSFRLLNLDTFETRLIGETTVDDKVKGLRIKEFTKWLFTEVPDVVIETKMKKGFYKRYLCIVKFTYKNRVINYNHMMRAFGADKHTIFEDMRVIGDYDWYDNLWTKYNEMVNI